MEIDRIYLIEGERYRLAQISTSLGSLPEYTFVPVANIELRTNARADVADATASVPAQYPITVDLTSDADELRVDAAAVNLGTPYTVDSAAVSAPPTDVDRDDATFVWDPPRINEILDARYPDRSGINGTFVGRRLQIQPADDPPELDLETTSVSRPDDGNVVLERFRPLHPQIPTGDTYRIVQPNINIASPATTNIFSDNVAVDAAGSRWIDDQMGKLIEEATESLKNILNKPAAEPIDNDAWDELFTPAT